MLAIYCRAGSPPKYRMRGSYARKKIREIHKFISARNFYFSILSWNRETFPPRKFQRIRYLFYIAKKSIFSIRTISLEHVFDAWYLLTALSFHDIDA